MPTFRLSIRLLDGSYHGKGDGGEPEWPPSPLRAFQALVCAAASRWDDTHFETYARPALAWIEGLGPPTILTPIGRTATRPYRLYVPNNAGDLMVAGWARGNSDASMAEHRTEKDVRPTRFEAGEPVHFDWPLTAEQHKQGLVHLEPLKAAARSITHVGWGIDQSVANAELLVEEPSISTGSERWTVAEDAPTPLRIPRPGTLDDLRRKHGEFMKRLGPDGFRPVPALRDFDVRGYRRATDPMRRPFAAFRIDSIDPDERGPSFDPVRRTKDVAGWLRHAVGLVCKDWPFESVASFVHGHDAADTTRPLKGEQADERFLYLPLPTINPALQRVESIRRVLVAAPAGMGDRLDWVRQRLAGQLLEEENQPEGEQIRGILNPLPGADWVLNQYVGSSQTWSTVTPVIVPGHDDGDADKVERMLRKAFVHAGVPGELLGDATRLEWRTAGFRPGVDLAQRYDRPAKLAGRRYHVRVRFPHRVSGPLAIGAGRYRGFGLFVAG